MIRKAIEKLEELLFPLSTGYSQVHVVDFQLFADIINKTNIIWIVYDD